MGQALCNAGLQVEDSMELNPLLSSFSPITHQVQIRHSHEKLFEKIKNRLKVVDCRGREGLQWYESPKYNLYLYGTVSRDRPFGDCFFYIQDLASTTTPLLIATSVNQYYVYSDETLILYPDKTIYYGSIKNNIAALPRAQGKGTLISRDFVYEGQFKNGYPHGFGTYRSKTIQYTGTFKNGNGVGDCIEKSAEQVFIGEIQEDGSKIGEIINKKNERKKVESKELEGSLAQTKLSVRSYPVMEQDDTV